MQLPSYDFQKLSEIFGVTVNGRRVWDGRLYRQQKLLGVLAESFGDQADIFSKAFAFNPGAVYFGTPLTSDPSYTHEMRDTWDGIKWRIETDRGWKQVYAPFDQTDPHSKTPDNLDSHDLSQLDHIRVLTSEVGVFDLNRPSNGVGRECSLALVAGMPVIGFSANRASRMDKGTPGIVVLSYRDNNELLNLLAEVVSRSGFETEPFYVDRRHEHKMQTVIKGDTCINCKFKDYLHPI